MSPSVALCAPSFPRELDRRHRTGQIGRMGPNETKIKAGCGKGPTKSVRYTGRTGPRLRKASKSQGKNAAVKELALPWLGNLTRGSELAASLQAILYLVPALTFTRRPLPG